MSPLFKKAIRKPLRATINKSPWAKRAAKGDRFALTQPKRAIFKHDVLARYKAPGGWSITKMGNRSGTKFAYLTWSPYGASKSFDSIDDARAYIAQSTQKAKIRMKRK